MASIIYSTWARKIRPFRVKTMAVVVRFQSGNVRVESELTSQTLSRLKLLRIKYFPKKREPLKAKVGLHTLS